MRHAYLNLVIVLAVVVLVNTLSERLSQPQPEFDLPRIFDGDSFESTLALNQPLKVDQVGIFELELISGISDTLANNILRKRADMLSLAATLLTEEKHAALELVHGIGPAKAKTLAKNLAFPDAPLAVPRAPQ